MKHRIQFQIFISGCRRSSAKAEYEVEDGIFENRRGLNHDHQQSLENNLSFCSTTFRSIFKRSGPNLQFPLQK